ncbi:MAG: TonB C-terminal domain-containing protein [Candidatus Cloacimonetes bacterium]|nr:TonB C-terminal domain-containing protein [Candidatus Cloacimonadota bacterium]
MIKLRFKTFEEKLGVYIILSIILHFIILLFLPKFTLMTPVPQKSETQKNPKLSFRIVETPAQDTPKPENARNISDKNSQAQQEELHPELTEGNPYAEETRMKETQSSESSGGEDHKRGELAQEQKSAGNPESNRAKAFWNLLQENREKVDKENHPETIQELNSSAYRQGGFALNTYAWDYAPYMLQLRDKIQGNLRPPMSFTRMGIGAGQNIVKFRIDRTGKLLSVKLLDSTTHETLNETSLRSIKYSFPFIQLPVDFPEEFLEITAYFSYIKQ